MNDIYLRASKLKMEIENSVNQLSGSKEFNVPLETEDFIIAQHQKKQKLD